MKILTYVTDSGHDNVKILQNKLSIELVPNYKSWDNNFYAKAYSIYKYLQNYNNEELIVCCDGYDVLPLNNCDSPGLMNAIYKNFDLSKITFNAEINCYPDQSLASRYPKNISKWKYLNAGLFSGKNIHIKKMYESVLDKIQHNMDQLELTKLFLDTEFINLDYTCSVFQSLYNGTIGGDMEMSDFIINNKSIINKHFNTMPLLFHGNGKINMSKLLPFL